MRTERYLAFFGEFWDRLSILSFVGALVLALGMFSAGEFILYLLCIGTIGGIFGWILFVVLTLGWVLWLGIPLILALIDMYFPEAEDVSS